MLVTTDPNTIGLLISALIGSLGVAGTVIVLMCESGVMKRIRNLFPSGRTLLTAALSSLLGGIVAIGVSAALGGHHATSGPPVDLNFVRVGRAYLPGLGRAYASAWKEGAASLEAGQSLSAAIAIVGKTWDAGRTQLFDRLVSPELARIVPESQKDAEVIPAQRRAMAAAWRGFARGLEE